MEITFLGTSSGVPTKKRNVSSVALRRGGEVLLFDVGENTQRQLIKSGIGLKRRIKMYVTHMHGDHVVGLLALLQSYSLIGKTDPLPIFGPRGITAFVQKNLNMLRVSTRFPIQMVILREGVVDEEKEYVIRALRTRHSVETYALSLEEKPRPGRFNPEKAEELGIPVKHWRDLKAGRKVVVGDKKIEPNAVVSPPRKGRKVVYSSDTYPMESMAEFARGADVLIHDSTYGDDHLDKTLENLHSTARQAAEIAKKARVGLLVLTHFSARYEETDQLVNQAREVFPNVIAAEDFLKIDVPYKDH